MQWIHLCNLLCVGRQRNGTLDRLGLTNVIKIFQFLSISVLNHGNSEPFSISQIWFSKYTVKYLSSSEHVLK